MGPNIVRIAGGGSIPQLTDEQKKIVAEFKQKMALLPPNQHAQFIAAHKANLIKQLNFQPTQLQSLKGAHVLKLCPFFPLHVNALNSRCRMLQIKYPTNEARV
jgi:hypothetical protein